MHAVGLAPRARVGADVVVVVDEVAVVDLAVGHGCVRRPPVTLTRPHVDDVVADREPQS